MKESRSKGILISVACIVGAAIFAILVHALMPSPGATINEDDFDSFLVKAIGFPVVASLYFIVLYTHIVCVIHRLGSKASISKRSVGLRYGICFMLLYIVGMQEVVVSGSPCEEWGLDFVLYQLFMGLGDAIPVLLLCVMVAGVSKTVRHQVSTQRTIHRKAGILVVVVFAVTFFVERVIGYVCGYLVNDLSSTPIPVLIWTIVFGGVLGGIYLILRPIYIKENGSALVLVKRMILTVGLNWIWFNSFIGLIYKDSIGQVLLRSCLDVIVMFGAGIVAEKILAGSPVLPLNRKDVPLT